MSKQDINNIIYFVIQVEQEGAKVYQKMARETPDEAAKETFLKLANDEIQHQKDFQELAKVLNKDVYPLDSSLDLVQILHTVSEKLKAIIKDSELVDIGEVTLKNALDIGIHSEKESIRVYTELLGINCPEIALVVPKVILEEKKHLVLLQNMKLQRLG